MVGFVEKKTPVSVVPRTSVLERDKKGMPLWDTSSRILALVGDNAIVAKKDTSPQDLKHLFVVILPEDGPDCSACGETLVRVDSNRVVMRVEPEKVNGLLSALHAMKGARCGLLGALPEVPIVPALPEPPSPWIGVEAKLDYIKHAMKGIKPSALESVIQTLCSMGTRVHDTPKGQTAGDKVEAFYKSTRNLAHQAKVRLISHKDTKQESVIVTIPGTVAPGETVVLGCHIDSWNAASSHDNPAPGADDDASGVACLVAVFNALMKLGPPARTIELHGYAAEEVGRTGSKDIASCYRVQARNVVAMLQLDMVLYPPCPGEEKVLWFVRQDTNETLRQQLSALGATYLETTSQEIDDVLGSSDHASWFALNYPTVWPFEHPSNGNLHGAGDTLESLGNQKKEALQRALLHARLALAFAAHFGGVSAPPATPPRRRGGASNGGLSRKKANGRKG
ncbi:MAG: M20/M25/M40 family metallo-hydrolase [Polyangiaceae bacterium]|nr:M20/M25/M40 family metallo-hydrolase [Polyangiaceae bacterium]